MLILTTSCYLSVTDARNLADFGTGIKPGCDRLFLGTHLDTVLKFGMPRLRPVKDSAQMRPLLAGRAFYFAVA